MRMPGVISRRAIHYREQAEQFERLADMETQPRARARLLELAREYEQLADLKPPELFRGARGPEQLGE